MTSSNVAAEPGGARARILHHAAQIASMEGLRGLTIGRLATAASTSKSNVVERFKGQDRLLVATVDYGVAVFDQHVIQPALVVSPGARRLDSLLGGWMHYVDERIFLGGCLLSRLAAEHPVTPEVGLVIDGHVEAWINLLATQARIAGFRNSQLFAFEVNAIGAYAAIGRTGGTTQARKAFRALARDRSQTRNQV